MPPLPAATAVALENIPRLLEALRLALAAVGLAHALLAAVGLAKGLALHLALSVLTAFVTVSVTVGLATPARCVAIVLAFRLALALFAAFAEDGSDVHGIRVLVRLRLARAV